MVVLFCNVCCNLPMQECNGQTSQVHIETLYIFNLAEYRDERIQSMRQPVVSFEKMFVVVTLSERRREIPSCVFLCPHS